MSEFYVEDESVTLDLFSTSPTLFQDLCFPVVSCSYRAPYFAYQKSPKRYAVVQGCCNHWDCPRCGIQVAKGHYGRIVEGCREIAKEQELWFITITCRGAGLSEEEATKNYLAWTSKFLDACYAKAKRDGIRWYYVQVTEKQKRGHPHSHILTSFYPSDVVDGTKDNWITNSNGDLVCEKIPCLRSAWLQASVISAGMGEQYDISKVETVEAASRYVAKYMFKKAQFEAHYPKRWKRVRYSNSFPKLKREKSNAFVLITAQDWQHLASVAVVVDAEKGDAYKDAEFWLARHDVVLNEQPVRQVDNSRENSYARSIASSLSSNRIKEK